LKTSWATGPMPLRNEPSALLGRFDPPPERGFARREAHRERSRF
jgi:hypothetical protein